jgi:hypothetical protein
VASAIVAGDLELTISAGEEAHARAVSSAGQESDVGRGRVPLRGDAALLRALLAQVERAFPGCAVKISGMEDAGGHPHFHGVPNLGSMRRYVHEEGSPGCVGRLARRWSPP